MQICAIIMASGYSRRFGSNKLLYQVDGKPLVRHVLDTLKQASCAEVIVVTRFEQIKEWAEELGFRVVINHEASDGQSSSVRLGVASARPCDGYMFFPADQPYISVVTINKLIETFINHPDSIIVPVFGSNKGTPTIFPAVHAARLLSLQGDIGGKKLIADGEKTIYVKIDNPDENIDFDTLVQKS